MTGKSKRDKKKKMIEVKGGRGKEKNMERGRRTRELTGQDGGKEGRKAA